MSTRPRNEWSKVAPVVNSGGDGVGNFHPRVVSRPRVISRQTVIAVMIIGCAFLVGWLGSVIYVNKTWLLDLYIESNLVRYQAMTSQTEGQATYFVFHRNQTAMQSITAQEQDIISLEDTRYDNLVKMSFVSSKSDAVDRVRQHEDVYLMANSSLPLICH